MSAVNKIKPVSIALEIRFSLIFLAGVVHKEDGSANFYGTKGYSWTGHHIEDLGDNRLAISAHMTKLNYVINTGGEVKIVDYDLNEILTIPNRELHSDQFGYSMIATDLMIDGKLRNELGTVNHIFLNVAYTPRITEMPLCFQIRVGKQ